ncbi:MAG: hypothetical protein E7287_03585 [Lachnospiraceae bacterium]|nr:hypothetical protein [Lachnospiraceae bacterium]
MRKILSYCKSHIYDLHYVLSGSITFLLMFLIKKPVKKWIAAKTDDKEKQKLWNGILIPITMLLGFLMFWVLSLISPLIHMSMPCALMSGAVALTEYAVFEQMCIGGGDEK